jgi:TolA-binding protein
MLPFSRVTATQEKDAEKQFGFAETLYAEGDFYRAITEYKRHIYFFPDDKNVERSHLGIAKSFFGAKRWNECITAVNKFIDAYPLSTLRTEALHLKGLAEKSLKRYDEAISVFNEIIRSPADAWYDKAIYQIALIFLEKEDWNQARSSFLLVPKASPYYGSAQNISEGLKYINEIPQKSPETAGVLAAILPGAGHLYAERPRDALVSFLLNASFIVAAIELYHHDHYVAGGIVTFIELGWYTGNIYSAVNSAHKYNKRMKEEFIDRLRENISISFSWEKVGGFPCISLSSSF